METPPDAVMRHADLARQGLDPGQVGAHERAVPHHVRVLQPDDAPRLHAHGQVHGVDARDLLPARHRHLAVARVEGHRHRLRPQARRLLHHAGVGHGGGAEDDAIRAALAIAHGGLQHAQAAAHLDRDLDRLDHLGHGVELRLAVDGGVEVHDVQASGAFRFPAAGHLDGIAAVDLLLLELALLEADHLAAADVDGGNDDHAAPPPPRRARARTSARSWPSGAGPPPGSSRDGTARRGRCRGRRWPGSGGRSPSPPGPPPAARRTSRSARSRRARRRPRRPASGAAAWDGAGSSPCAGWAGRPRAAARGRAGARGPDAVRAPRSPRTGAASRCRCRAACGPASTASRRTGTSRRRSISSIVEAKAPSPGRIRTSARRSSSTSPVSTTGASRWRKRLHHAARGSRSRSRRRRWS